MFCPNCGNQIPENSFFCPSCGANLQENNSFEPPVNLEDKNELGFASVLRRALCSGKFLAMCIMITIAGVLSFAPTTISYTPDGIASYSSSFDLFAILSTVAMWITYANAKSKSDVMPVGGLKFNAVLAKITFVLNWIAAIIMLVCGAIFFAVIPMISSIFADEAATDMFFAELIPMLEQNGLGGYIESLTGDLVRIVFIGMAVAFVVVGIILALINIFYYGKVKNFANNLHISYITNRVTDLRFSTISVWFMVMGILEGIGSISAIAVNPTGAISAISITAATIIASVWVKELGEAITQPEEINE